MRIVGLHTPSVDHYLTPSPPPPSVCISLNKIPAKNTYEYASKHNVSKSNRALLSCATE